MNMIESLNIDELKMSADRFVSRMFLTDFHAQPQGFLNGGATLSFAEITAGMASNQLGQGQYFAVGQTIMGNHLNPKKAEGFVTAHGLLIKNGRSSHVWEIKILDETEQLISQVTVTNALIDTKKY